MDLNLLLRQRWHSGQLLAFSGVDGPTDFYDGLTARTAPEPGEIEIKLPGPCRLHFKAPRKILIAGDFFELEMESGPVRAAFLDAHHLLVEGVCSVEGAGAELLAHTSGSRTLLGSAAHFAPALIDADLDAALEARSRWLRRQVLPAGLALPAARAAAKALSILKSQVYTPEGTKQHRWTTPDRWPHRAMWLWDSVFHAIGWRHLDPPLARSMLSAVLDVQRPDGFIAHASDPRRSSSVTQPPLLALGVELVNGVDPQPEWIAEVYPKLCAYIEWDLAQRDSDGNGLLEWEIEADINCRSGESGMDNSSRFDAATQLDAVDFNAYLASECRILAGFARQLGQDADAQRWEARWFSLCQLINARLWSESAQFYLDFNPKLGQHSPVLACTGFLPLLCGAASPAQVQVLARQLVDPAMFGTPLRVASIAAKDSVNYAKDMWRGPVWMNLNWLIAYGFEQAGLRDLAEALRAESMAEIEDTCARYGTFFEFFDDRHEVDPPALLRKGRCAPEISPYHQVIHDYGWTATLYVDWLFSRPTLSAPGGKAAMVD